MEGNQGRAMADGDAGAAQLLHLAAETLLHVDLHHAACTSLNFCRVHCECDHYFATELDWAICPQVFQVTHSMLQRIKAQRTNAVPCSSIQSSHKLSLALAKHVVII